MFCNKIIKKNKKKTFFFVIHIHFIKLYHSAIKPLVKVGTSGATSPSELYVELKFGVYHMSQGARLYMGLVAISKLISISSHIITRRACICR